jgi:predicted transcriptional regulator
MSKSKKVKPEREIIEQIEKLDEEVTITADVTTDATATDKLEARINILVSVLPKKVTPKHLCQLFGFDDGGKIIRRHLRNKFAEGHEYRDKWEWDNNDKTLRKILAYFEDKYESYPERLKAAN